jgi:hypothetical protein
MFIFHFIFIDIHDKYSETGVAFKRRINRVLHFAADG